MRMAIEASGAQTDSRSGPLQVNPGRLVRIERIVQTVDFVTIAGNAALGALYMSGGRLAGPFVGGDWAVKPRLGVTYARTTRDGMTEANGSAFALNVARDRHVAGFVDGGVTFGRSAASDAAFRPSLTLGARSQVDGKRVGTIGGYAGGGFDLAAFGPSRAAVVGTAAGTVACRFAGSVDLFATASAQTGKDDHQEAITAGVRIGF
jgi:outer membrane autotransporter protein